MGSSTEAYTCGTRCLIAQRCLICSVTSGSMMNSFIILAWLDWKNKLEPVLHILWVCSFHKVCTFDENTQDSWSFNAHFHNVILFKSLLDGNLQWLLIWHTWGPSSFTLANILPWHLMTLGTENGSRHCVTVYIWWRIYNRGASSIMSKGQRKTDYTSLASSTLPINQKFSYEICKTKCLATNQLQTDRMPAKK